MVSQADDGSFPKHLFDGALDGTPVLLVQNGKCRFQWFAAGASRTPSCQFFGDTRYSSSLEWKNAQTWHERLRTDPANRTGSTFVLPATNGYSMVGEVLETGGDVSCFRPGERVFVPAPHEQIASIPAALAVPLPAGIPDEQAAFLNILEVGHTALRRGRPEPGADVAIVGQGVIGLSVLAWCRAFGFRAVVVDPHPTRREIALRMGAGLAVSPDEKDFLPRMADHLDGEGPDLVVEAASDWPALRAALEIARPDGRVVVASRHTGTPDFNPVGHPFLGKRLELVTSYGHQPDGRRWDRRRSFALAVRLFREGKLRIEPMITHRFAWHELPEVYRRLDEGDRDIVGAVFQWNVP